MADITAHNGADLLELIGKSLAFPGTNAFIGADAGEREIMVCIAPPWADLIAAAFPDIDDGAERAGRARGAARLLVAGAAPRAARDDGRVDARGMVPLVARPDQMIVMVCGGLGNLHALALHSFGPTQAVTRPF